MLPKESISISEAVDYLAILKSGAIFRADLSEDQLFSLHESPEFWNYLLSNLHFTEIKILEALYFPVPVSMYFDELVQKISKCNIRRTALRNIISKLERVGLVKSANSGLLFIFPELNLNEHMKRFIVLAKARFGVKNG